MGKNWKGTKMRKAGLAAATAITIGITAKRGGAVEAGVVVAGVQV
jgi:hypothetical protein